MLHTVKRILMHFTSDNAATLPQARQRPFDLVVIFSDGSDDASTSFASAQERDSYVEKLIDSPRAAEIESVNYEHVCVFWRQGEELPCVAPALAGEGAYMLRAIGSKNSLVEVEGHSLTTAVGVFKKTPSSQLGELLELMVVRRRRVYERHSVLVRSDSIPRSAQREED